MAAGGKTMKKDLQEIKEELPVLEERLKRFKTKFSLSKALYRLDV